MSKTYLTLYQLRNPGYRMPEGLRRLLLLRQHALLQSFLIAIAAPTMYAQQAFSKQIG